MHYLRELISDLRRLFHDQKLLIDSVLHEYESRYKINFAHVSNQGFPVGIRR